MLRFITYLAPSLPGPLFESITRTLGEALGVETALSSETRFSGPPLGTTDPFSANTADVGFVCAPSFVRLRRLSPAPIELVTAAPLFDDPRNTGRPVYFSDVIVRRNHAARSLLDLRGQRWVYNDRCSLSGYHSVVRELERLSAPAGFFAAARPSGGHIDSIDRVTRGIADCAAIDSNVLRLRLEGSGDLAARVRIVASLGPFPVQPIVIRTALAPSLGPEIADALTRLADPELRDRYGLVGFVPIVAPDYERACQATLPREPIELEPASA